WVGAIDLSKVAVRLAARRTTGIDYAVADAFGLPVEDGSLDVVLSVFGPVVSAEAERVLAPGGVVIAVGPGPLHLIELKQLLMDHPSPHPLRGPTGFERHFRGVARWRVSFQVQIAQQHLGPLATMTPYGHL